MLKDFETETRGPIKEIIAFEVYVRVIPDILVSRPLPYEYLNHHATAFEPLLGLPPLVKC